MKSISQFIFIDDGVCFNRSMQADNAGWIAVPLGAYMNKTQMQLQLSIPVIQKPGYVYVYLRYESESANWVYFDDLKLSYKRSPVVQTNSYYAFGLSAESWTRIDTKPNKYLYNAGSELNDKTGSYEMFFRSYDPAIGRMSGVDVMAATYATLSPYQYANNSPVVFNDPTGAYPDQYERASRGGCGCWRDKGAQDNGAGGVDYNQMTYGAPSMGGSAFGRMGAGIMTNGFAEGRAQRDADARAVKDGKMSLEDYGTKYGQEYRGEGFTGLIDAISSNEDAKGRWLVQMHMLQFVGGQLIAIYTYAKVNGVTQILRHGPGSKIFNNYLSTANNVQSDPTPSGTPGRSSWFWDHFVTEIEGRLSAGPQAALSVLPNGAIVPAYFPGILGGKINLGSKVILGIKGSSRTGVTYTAPSDEAMVYGTAITGGGVAVEWTKVCWSKWNKK